MKRVKLQRLWEDRNQSTGVLTVLTDSGQPMFASLCIERGDRNNQRNVSNVPAGTYPLVLEFSPRFQRKLYELKDVPNRSECKVHASNYWHQLNGCIAPGVKLKDMNSDGYYDVTDSRKALDAFHRALKGVEKTTIEIIDPVD
ncbi:MAG: DUF5675 family protein [Bacteroidota bacterium]